MKHVLDLLKLNGEVAIVTGGHAWLGLDIASALAEAGADIVLTSRNPQSCRRAAEEISETYGVQTLVLPMDQCDSMQVKKMAEKAYTWKNRLDILVNNAGGGSGFSEGNLLDRSFEDIQSMIATNLTGMIFCCKAVAPYMIRRKYGKIINMGSIAALVGRDRKLYRDSNKMEQPVDYAASKGGIVSATRDLAAALAPYNICVNSISPGGFDKGDLPEDFVNGYSALTPLGRMGRMGEDIKGAALLLASPAGNYITGHNLVVDGGFSVTK